MVPLIKKMKFLFAGTDKFLINTSNGLLGSVTKI